MKWLARLGGAFLVAGAISTLAIPAMAQNDEVDGVFGDTILPELPDEDLDSSLPSDDPSGDFEGLGADDLGGSGEADDLGDLTGEATDDLTDDLSDELTEEIPSAAPELTQPNTPAPQIAAPATDGVENIPAGQPIEASQGEADAVLGQAIPAEDIVPQETIRERYDNGQVRIERGVAQDEQENYINHGPWKMWDESGQLVAEGTYRLGKRHGRWVRVYQTDEADLFSLAPFNLFNGPFRSQADFIDGQLDGHWMVSDQNGTKVCDWEFSLGRRNGDSIWYYHNQNTMRLIQYRDGQIHGELREWDIDGQALTSVEYFDGRRLEKTQESYEDGSKKVEGSVLRAQLEMKEPDAWWEAKLAQYTRKGKDQKHGEWTAWYPSGSKKFAGEYEWDEPSGTFTWWHANGQKSLEAIYDAGRKSGQWTWWHENGQKSIQGQYLADSPVNRWIWWHESGKVAQRIDFSAAAAPTDTGQYLPTGDSIILQDPQN